MSLNGRAGRIRCGFGFMATTPNSSSRFTSRLTSRCEGPSPPANRARSNSAEPNAAPDRGRVQAFWDAKLPGAAPAGELYYAGPEAGHVGRLGRAVLREEF